MATNLAAGKCVAYRGGKPTLTDAETAELPWLAQERYHHGGKDG